MKEFILSIMVLGCVPVLEAQIVGVPYNPDYNNDSLVTTIDLLEFLPLFEEEFIPTFPVLVLGCTDANACNFNPSANVSYEALCEYLDDCGICGGEGAIYECGCSDLPEGACDCEGNQLDALNVCGGPCSADADGNGICDDYITCPGEYDECGVCNGPGAIYECGCSEIVPGNCDCYGIPALEGTSDCDPTIQLVDFRTAEGEVDTVELIVSVFETDENGELLFDENGELIEILDTTYIEVTSSQIIWDGVAEKVLLGLTLTNEMLWEYQASQEAYDSCMTTLCPSWLTYPESCLSYSGYYSSCYNFNPANLWYEFVHFDLQLSYNNSSSFVVPRTDAKFKRITILSKCNLSFGGGIPYVDAYSAIVPFTYESRPGYFESPVSGGSFSSSDKRTGYILESDGMGYWHLVASSSD